MDLTRSLNCRILILILCLSILTAIIPHGSALQGAFSQPMQAMYSGTIAFSPNPPIAGNTESFQIEIRNVGSIVFKVTNVELRTDWAVAYYAIDVPQVIDGGASYKFATLSVPIPSSAVGGHTFSTRFWVELTTSSGSWSQESVEKLDDIILNIASGPVITGPTTIVLPTQEFTCDQVNCYIVVQGTTQATLTGMEQSMKQQSLQGIDWGSLLLPAAVILLAMLVVLVGWLVHLQKRRMSNPKTDRKP